MRRDTDIRYQSDIRYAVARRLQACRARTRARPVPVSSWLSRRPRPHTARIILSSIMGDGRRRRARHPDPGDPEAFFQFLSDDTRARATCGQPKPPNRNRNESQTKEIKRSRSCTHAATLTLTHKTAKTFQNQNRNTRHAGRAGDRHPRRPHFNLPQATTSTPQNSANDPSATATTPSAHAHGTRRRTHGLARVPKPKPPTQGT
eukprot:scaffold32690_cov107-Isochrysis_galbana.AAC.3